MFRAKLQTTGQILLALIIISLVYTWAGLNLLRSHQEKIRFTQKELWGVSDYARLSELYLELHQTHDEKHVAKKLINLSGQHFQPLVEQAKTKILADTSLSINALSHLLRRTIRAIGDESNLILDPEKPSYYAMDLLFNYVPLLVEHVAIYRQSPLDDAEHHLEGLGHSIGVVVQIASEEGKIIAESFSHIQRHLRLKKTQHISEPEARKVLADIQTLHGSALRVLRQLLEQRLHAYMRHYYTMVAIIVSLYFVLVGLMFLAIRNYVSKRELSSAKERERLIVDLAKKNDELEKFAYAAAHDLKEPVRTMRCFATLLKSETRNLSTEATLHIGVIENTAKRAEEMINDLLGYTRVSEEAMTVEACDCKKELEAVLEDLKPAIQSIAPIIHVSGLPIVQTVPSMFRRVMLNLIDNAIKYRREDVLLELHINAERRAVDWLFSVHDNGIGLASEHAEMVFEPFKRLNPSVLQEGSGIGLTSCRKIIERLGGRVWIEPNQQSGITVFFTIPVR